MKIVLYSRRGCHLCEQVEEMLASRPAETVVVDVDAAPGLAEEFGTRVPVVEVDGRILIEGRFEERELLRLLAGNESQA